MPFQAINLSCLRGNRIVFEGVHFSLAPGEMMTLTGQNGSGKTSLLRILAGVLEPFEGKLESWPEEKEWIATELPFSSDLSVWQNLKFWEKNEEKIENGLDYFDCLNLKDKIFGKLSEGQKKRVNLSRLLHKNSALWLLDEPLNTLDTHAIEKLQDLIQTYLEKGGMAVIATHRPQLWNATKTAELP